MATHSSVLAWRIPGTGEPSGLPSMGSPGRARSPLPGGPGSPRSEGGRQARAELRQVTPHPPPPPEIHTRKRRVMISSGDD